MKTLKIVLVAFVLMLSITTLANNGKKENFKSVVTTEISSLLKNPGFEVENTLEARVSFMLNSKNEIVVLNVEADNENLDAYIKNRLNYNKLVNTGLKVNQTYILPVKIVRA
jgi:hypothetical protein